MNYLSEQFGQWQGLKCAREWVAEVEGGRRERVQGTRRAILMAAEVTQNDGQTRGRRL